MSYLVVCSLARLAETARRHRPGHMLTVLSQGTAVDRPAGIAPDRHLHLSFNDIAAAAPGLVSPAEAHMRAIVDFARRWDRAAPLLIHCFAGVSRSTASAYVIAAALDPAREEAELARELRLRSPTATPNRRLVALGDAMLGRQGRMVAAIGAIGRGADCFEGEPFVLPLRAEDAGLF
ncbi:MULTISPECIES: tyrosine phosphatase family protein [unclassified Roseitalea]|uniref:tyrosine phosphatase family protein n=1 Tax=unclassified Roseitalea TaxID=2639107 RepID=UPI00273F64C7|nr:MULTISPECIES: tyrosine phosphatase family protein [unclassified Roseitalea]